MVGSKKVLVTGAGGFIGSHLVQALVTRGARVTCMLRYNSASSLGNLEFLPAETRRDLTILAGNVEDSDFMLRAVSGQAAPGAVATLGAASGIVAVMSLLGFRTALSFSEMLVAILAAGLGWLAGLWLGGHPLIGELSSLWGRVRRWA